MADDPDRSERLIVRAADFPHGIRCGECKRLMREGERYAEIPEGFIGDTIGVVLVGMCCAASGEESS